jgi:hypothetical protein
VIAGYPLLRAQVRRLVSFTDLGSRRVEVSGLPFGPGEVAIVPPPVARTLPLTILSAFSCAVTHGRESLPS